MPNDNVKSLAAELANSGKFATERLQLAIFLHATEALRFLGCESSGFGRIRFIFADPESGGAQHELEFDRGAAVPATAIFASQKFLRREMSKYLRNGQSKNNERNHNSRHGRA